METNSEIKQFCEQIQEKVLKATKCSLGIKSSDFNYFNSFDKFNKLLIHQNRQSLQMISTLIQNEDKVRRIEKMVSDDDKYDLISELNDNMFDKMSNYLDEASGLKKKDSDLVLATISGHKHTAVNTSSWNRHRIRAKRGGNCNLLSAKMVERSQTRFKDRIDNSNNPFVPIITDKPNSIKPLSILVETTEDGFDTYSHPYEVEIEKFEPNNQFLEIEIPEFPKPVSETKFKLITKREDFIEMCEQLKTCHVIAVDLEHHSYRTFQGFTCLMQISSKSCDYIIDTIELRSDIHLLNDVFTSPAILKVFHGSDMDIVWMQRDFGLYVVNLFDTFQSAKLLEFSHLSLSHLLKHYCNIEADKQFQLADWRIRPLTHEMVKYAREDTHYLIFIYIQMKNELIARGNAEKNLLRAVFERSKTVCLKKYEKPLFNGESYRSLLKKSKVKFNSKQLYALEELYAWRDRMARNEDESIGYVLPNHMLLHIAEVLPREQQGILASCNPIPPLVKQQLNEIHLIVLKARNKPLTETNENVTQYHSNISSLANRVIDLDELIDCRHDKFGHDLDLNNKTLIEEYYDNQLIQTEEPQKSIDLDISSPFIQFFSPLNISIENKIHENICSSFMSQYERYNLTLERKRKSDNESQDLIKKTKNVSNDNMNRIYSHYMNLTSGSQTNQLFDEKLETISSKNCINDEKDSDISVISVDKPKTEEKTFKRKEKLSSDKTDEKAVEGFEYEKYDYSMFSVKNNTNTKTNFESKRKGQQMTNRKRNTNRRNETKSYSFNPNNKKQKY